MNGRLLCSKGTRLGLDHRILIPELHLNIRLLSALGVPPGGRDKSLGPVGNGIMICSHSRPINWFVHSSTVRLVLAIENGLLLTKHIITRFILCKGSQFPTLTLGFPFRSMETFLKKNHIRFKPG